METEYSHELGRRHVIQYVATIPQAQAVWCASPSPSPAGQESCELLLILHGEKEQTQDGGREEKHYFIQYSRQKGDGWDNLNKKIRSPSFHESDGERRRGRRAALVSK
jgi:hypothetical protein